MGASITRTRRLEWTDTDASGVWHHSTVWRWVEWLEVELLRELGITDPPYGLAPRRSVAAEFLRPIVFDDEVTCRLEVADMGGTSVTYACEVRVDDELAVAATLTCVLVDATGRPRRWPDTARDRLAGTT